MDSMAVSRWCDARRETYATRGPGSGRDRGSIQAANGRARRDRGPMRTIQPCALPFRARPDRPRCALGVRERDGGWNAVTGRSERTAAASRWVRALRNTPGPEMIPFTSRALNWHTDGYYNAPGQSVRAVVMHCAAPAASGGETTLLDPDLVHAVMHEQDPLLVEALAHPRAMTIPSMKPTGAGATCPHRTRLPLPRRSPRTCSCATRCAPRSIRWRSTPATARAVAALEAMIASLSAHHVRVRFEAGEGVICNNVLHRRARRSSMTRVRGA